MPSRAPLLLAVSAHLCYNRLMNTSLPVIGQNELVSIGTRAIDVPAKIDTGADSSSIWASDIKVRRDGTLIFKLFGEGSDYYSGKVFKRTDYKVAMVRSAMGEEQIRYRTRMTIKVAGRKIRVLFNLSDRSRNNFKILIGRRTVSGKFLVDVSKKAIAFPKHPQTAMLNKKLTKNPYKFHKKYVKVSK